jgi:hypothetical protein
MYSPISSNVLRENKKRTILSDPIEACLYPPPRLRLTPRARFPDVPNRDRTDTESKTV